MMLRFGLVLVFAGLVTIAFVFPDDPPPAHTGGFGEPTCLACHFDNAPDDGVAVLELRGLSDRITPGASYDLELILVREEMLRAGFQLSARNSDGNDAGTLKAADDQTTMTSDGSVTYLQHTLAGSDLSGPDSVRWAFRWTAPDDIQEVLFHASANAANGDESQFGDYVYSIERKVSAAD